MNLTDYYLMCCVSLLVFLHHAECLCEANYFTFVWWEDNTFWALTSSYEYRYIWQIMGLSRLLSAPLAKSQPQKYRLKEALPTDGFIFQNIGKQMELRTVFNSNTHCQTSDKISECQWGGRDTLKDFMHPSHSFTHFELGVEQWEPTAGAHRGGESRPPSRGLYSYSVGGKWRQLGSPLPGPRVTEHPASTASQA